jgi:hypothetical protein
LNLLSHPSVQWKAFACAGTVVVSKGILIDRQIVQMYRRVHLALHPIDDRVIATSSKTHDSIFALAYRSTVYRPEALDRTILQPFESFDKAIEPSAYQMSGMTYCA